MLSLTAGSSPYPTVAPRIASVNTSAYLVIPSEMHSVLYNMQYEKQRQLHGSHQNLSHTSDELQ